MACASPITVEANGRLVQTRCRQCLPCRIYLQSSLTFQCLLENHLALSGQFITLTFAEDQGLGDYKPFKMFMDRLRVRNRRAGNQSPIRFLGCGEYGDTTGRFHYHGLIWNSLLFDQEEWRTALWPHGHSHIGEITPSSVKYTTGYTTKFADQGENFVHGKSERPPLGELLMTSLGAKARLHGHNFPEVPTHMKWGGRSYPLNGAMQIAWMEGYDPSKVLRNARNTRVLAKSSVEGAKRRVENLLCPDGSRLVREARAIKRSRERKLLGKL